MAKKGRGLCGIGRAGIVLSMITDDDSLNLHQQWIADASRGLWLTNHHNHFINLAMIEEISKAIEITAEAMDVMIKTILRFTKNNGYIHHRSVIISIVVGLLNLIKKFNLSQNQKSLEIILKKLSEENKLTREALSGVIKANIEGVYIGVKSTNEAILDNVKNIAEGNHQKITEMKEELARGLNDIKYNVRESLKEVRG